MAQQVLFKIWKIVGIEVDESIVPMCQDFPREQLLNDSKI